MKIRDAAATTCPGNSVDIGRGSEALQGCRRKWRYWLSADMVTSIPDRRHRFRYLAVAAAALIVGGCGGSSPAAVQQPPRSHARPGPFTTIVFTSDRGKPVEYVAPSMPTTEIVGKVGTFTGAEATSTIDSQRKSAESAGDETLLVFDRDINGVTESTLFTVISDRAIDVAMNGLGVGAPDQHQLVIKVPADSAATIVAADVDAAKTPFVAGKLELSPDNVVTGLFTKSHHGRVDLDSGTDNNVGTAAADIDISGLGTLKDPVKMTNGAEVVKWDSEIQPTLSTCESLPAGRWSDTLIPGGLVSIVNAVAQVKWHMVSYGVWCVRSKKGRYGYLVQLADTDRVGLPLATQGSLPLQFTLWKAPSDTA